MTRCLYSIVGCEVGATIDQVRWAYRAMARKLHPDSNYEENTTDKFTELTKAYEILSDPEKKDFYDKNRDKIEASNFAIIINALNKDKYVDEEITLMNLEIEMDKLYTAKETKWSDHDLKAPIFGDEASPEQDVQNFYKFWGSFQTNISFNWLNARVDFSELQNRSERRAIITENNRKREDAKKLRNKILRVK
ncbi:MAG: hypothetical protein MHPSP_001434 [Paramarteilia canceri]